MSEKTNSEKLWTLPFIMVILVSLCSAVAAQMTYPLVAKYSIYLGADIGKAGTISGLMSLAALFVCPFAGILSDLVSRKTILQISSVIYGFVLIAHGFITNIDTLVALRLLVGLFFSINSVTIVAFSTSFIPKKKMGEGLGYAALANILAQAVGPGVALKIVNNYGYKYTFIVAGCFAFLCAFLITLLKYDYVKPAKARKIQLSDLFAFKYMGWMLLATLFSCGTGLVSTFIAIIGEERAITNIALYFTVYSGFMVFLKPSIGKIVDRVEVKKIVTVAIVFAAIGMTLLGNSYSIVMVVLASSFNAIGQGAGVPTLQADIIKRMDSSKTGVATSTIQIGQNIGNAVAPMIGGMLAKNLAYNTIYTGYGAFLLVAGLIILFTSTKSLD